METFDKSEQNPGVDASSKQGRNVIPRKMTRIFRRVRENTLEPYLALFLRCAPNSERRPPGPCIWFNTDNVREPRSEDRPANGVLARLIYREEGMQRKAVQGRARRSRRTTKDPPKLTNSNAGSGLRSSPFLLTSSWLHPMSSITALKG